MHSMQLAVLSVFCFGFASFVLGRVLFSRFVVKWRWIGAIRDERVLDYCVGVQWIRVLLNIWHWTKCAHWPSSHCVCSRTPSIGCAAKVNTPQILIEVNYCSAFACKPFSRLFLAQSSFVRLLAFGFGLGHSNFVLHFSVYNARRRSNTDTIRCVKIILIDILDNVNGKQSMEPKIEVWKCTKKSRKWTKRNEYIRRKREWKNAHTDNDVLGLINKR